MDWIPSYSMQRYYVVLVLSFVFPDSTPIVLL